MADGTIRIGTKLDLSGLKSNIKELERELNNVRKEQAKVDAQADSINKKYADEREFDAQFPDEYSHREDIDKRAAQELDPVIAKQEELNQKEQYFVEKLAEANAKLQEQSRIAQASKELDGAVKSDAILDKIQTQQQYNSLLAETKAKMASIEAHAEGIATKHGVSKEKILESYPAYQKLKDTLSVLENTTKKFGDEAKEAGDKAKSGFKKAKKESNGLGVAIGKGIKMTGKLALAVFGIRSAYNAVRMAANEYLACNEELQGHIDTLKAGFGQVIGPVIEWMVGLLMEAIPIINSFVYALTGINYVAKANEAALKKQGKAAAEAKNQLAGFDEMNKLGESTDSNVGKLDDTITDLPDSLEQIKDQIQNDSWYEAGSSVMESFFDGICGVSWMEIGANIGEFLGDALMFALGLVLEFDPIKGHLAIVKLLSGLIQGLTQAIQDTDWGKVGGDIVEFLIVAIGGMAMFGNLPGLILGWMFTTDDTEIFSSVSEFVGSLIGALAKAVVGAAQKIWDIASSIVDWFAQYIDLNDIGWHTIGGLLQGIGDAFKGIGDWIWNNIWVPFRDGFMESFEIHSPSKKMKEFGENIIDGLRNGITDKIDKLKLACDEIWKAIKDKFANVGSWFETTFSDAWQKVKDVFSKGGKIFDGIKEGISSTFKTIVNGLIGGINKIIATPFNNINAMLNQIRSVSFLGISPFSSLWSYNPLTIPQIPKLALGGIVNRPGRGVPAIIGEAGAEAVLPLENNTEWMDMLAEKIGGNVTIPIYMDGKKIATYVVDIQKKKAFALNGA